MYKNEEKIIDIQIVATILFIVSLTISLLLTYNDKYKTKYGKGFFNNAGGYVYPHYIWWDIESFYPGYWGKLDNLYRYNTSLTSGLDKNEAMVLITNLILGFNTGYYFETFGLSLEKDKLFNISSTSKNYNNSMKKAIDEGKIANNSIIKKFWYADSEQYNYTLNNGTGCYNNKNDYEIKIINITRDYSNSNYNHNISLPFVNCIGHLGFEIIENDTVIGFINDLFYIDKIQYLEDYIPKYKIVAYDRLLDYKESN